MTRLHDDPTLHPKPYPLHPGDRIVFGDPVFRRYLVVHDMRPLPHPGQAQLGLAALDPSYEVLSPPPPASEDEPAAGQGASARSRARHLRQGGDKAGGGHFDGGGWRVTTLGVVKMGLLAVGQHPARRYLVRVRVGTPAQALSLVLDTGSYLTQVYTCPPCRSSTLSQSSKPRSSPAPAPPSTAHARAHAHSLKAVKPGERESDGKKLARNSIAREDKAPETKGQRHPRGQHNQGKAVTEKSDRKDASRHSVRALHQVSVSVLVFMLSWWFVPLVSIAHARISLALSLSLSLALSRSLSLSL